MDTNGDGAVDALDEVTGTETETETTTTDDASSAADEIQMDTNGDGAVDALDEVTGTAEQKQLLLMTHPLLLMKSKWIPMVMEQ